MTNDRPDDLIDRLIRPPRPCFTGFDWSHTDRLTPTGAASREKVVSERLKFPADPRA